jgi:hypothetical protein
LDLFSDAAPTSTGISAGVFGPGSGHGLSEIENERERFVDRLLFGGCQSASELFEPLYVDRTQLLDEHSGALLQDLDLGSKCRRRAAEAGATVAVDNPRSSSA